MGEWKKNGGVTIFDRVLDLEHALELLHELVTPLCNAFPVLEGRCVVNRFGGEEIAQVFELDGRLLVLLQWL